MTLSFPPEVITAAAHYQISPSLAFGLGEGLNLFYSRRPGERPPHRLSTLPDSYSNRLNERMRMPRQEAIAAALAGNGYGVMICTGDWHGVDAIEKWAEDLSLWPSIVGWEQSVMAAVTLIRDSDGLYRRSYTAFLDDAAHYFPALNTPRALLVEIADEWLDIAQRLEQAAQLEQLSSRILRMAGRESRFWGKILDQFGKGI